MTEEKPLTPAGVQERIPQLVEAVTSDWQIKEATMAIREAAIILVAE